MTMARTVAVMALVAAAVSLPGAASAAPGKMRVVSTIPSKGIVGGFAYGANSLWASDVQDTTLLRIDPRTNAITARIRIGRPLRFIDDQDQVDGWVRVGDGFVWATDQEHDRIVRVSPGSNRVVASIRVPSPWDIAVADGAAWVPQFEPYTVVRIDEATNTIARRWPAVGPTSVAAGAGSIWVVAHRADEVLRIDPTTNRVIATIPLTQATSPERIYFLFGTPWVSDGNDTDNELLRISPETNTVSAVVKTPGANFGNILVSDAKRLWSVSPVGRIYEINPTTDTVIRQQSFATPGRCGGYQGPCFFTDATYAAGTIWVYDLEQRSILRIRP